MTDHDLRQALRDCYLRTGQNIVDAGLLQSATLTPDLDAPGLLPRLLATITFYAPSLDEAANAQLAAQIENRLLGLQTISRAKIVLLPPLFPIL